ncbi:hypothetical protein [Amycolatopsis marina]|uniref:hypothetical protein n=1 Tax=Amycolatopsis marina TaxID=490629 RepID=UPI0011607573|nr:hypothetical protein [Amycolatopsis marina]
MTIIVPFLLMLRSHAGLPRGGGTLLVTTVAGPSVAVVDFPPVAVGNSPAWGRRVGPAPV